MTGHADFAHEFVLPFSPAEAMPLFTPKGEEGWVPHWSPVYVTPPSGETAEEMVFITDQDGEVTYWICLAWRPAAGHARYLRLTPGKMAAFVDISCRAEGEDGTRVRVGYVYHALGEAGQAHLAGLDQQAFAQMIGKWPEMIAAAG